MNSNSPKSRLQQQQQQEQVEEQQQKQTTERVFETAEEVIRYDAAQTVPPASIGTRLKDSVAHEPPPKPWWRRLFGGRNDGS